MAWRVVALDALPDEPWRNGGGRTRTIAMQSREAGEPPWDWRISVATVERSGPFSAFADVDRASLLLGSGQIELSAAGEATRRLQRPGEVMAYRGDAAWQATVQRDGSPLLLLNVMTRRGAAAAKVQALSGDANLRGRSLTVLAMGGRWRVDGVQVAVGDGAVSEADATPRPQAQHWRIERLSATGWLAAVTIDPMPSGGR